MLVRWPILVSGRYWYRYRLLGGIGLVSAQYGRPVFACCHVLRQQKNMFCYYNTGRLVIGDVDMSCPERRLIYHRDLPNRFCPAITNSPFQPKAWI
ncbi:hypothetical protein LZ30DRAFT_697623 [Colletotrichum cereale]|nr:hypothetical protein LZ30DRAFT_697623 [Colletotrichum cereale]